MYQNCPKLIGISVTPIKPCPFCKGFNVRPLTDANNIIKVACFDCGTEGPAVEINMRNKDNASLLAVKKWNNR